MNTLDSIITELDGLQIQISELQKTIEGLDESHSSLKSDHIELSTSHKLDEDFDQVLLDIQNNLSTSISLTEEMINGLFSQERLDHLNEFFQIQQSLVKKDGSMV